MMTYRHPRRRAAAVPSLVLASLVVGVAITGCSSGPAELVAPSRAVLESAPAAFVEEPAEVLAPPVTQPPLIHSKPPRMQVWTEDWRGVRDQGFSLDPSHIHDLVVAAGEPVEFQWSARAMTGQGSIVGFRWALDIEDITDETPRLDENDLAHWSTWTPAGTSAALGPFAPGSIHVFSVEARDNRGFVSLVTLRVITDAGEALVPGRR